MPTIAQGVLPVPGGKPRQRHSCIRQAPQFPLNPFAATVLSQMPTVTTARRVPTISRCCCSPAISTTSLIPRSTTRSTTRCRASCATVNALTPSIISPTSSESLRGQWQRKCQSPGRKRGAWLHLYGHRELAAGRSPVLLAHPGREVPGIPWRPEHDLGVRRSRPAHGALSHRRAEHAEHRRLQHRHRAASHQPPISESHLLWSQGELLLDARPPCAEDRF